MGGSSYSANRVPSKSVEMIFNTKCFRLAADRRLACREEGVYEDVRERAIRGCDGKAVLY
jgi:hypothetical protein